MKQGQPHRHGMMGTNPNTTHAHGDPDVGEVRLPNLDRGSGYEMMSASFPTHERRLEGWANGDPPPWHRPPPLVDAGPLLARMIASARRERLLHVRVWRRAQAAWLTLRHGPEYWREW